jgi:hypothetical protein
MAAGRWDTTIDRGAVWRRTLHYRDAAGSPVAISAPGYMDLRSKPDDDAPLVVRIDSTGSAAGTMTFPAAGSVSLEIRDEETLVIPTGKYYYDLFVTDSTGEFVKLVYGVISVRANVSVP